MLSEIFSLTYSTFNYFSQFFTPSVVTNGGVATANRLLPSDPAPCVLSSHTN